MARPVQTQRSLREPVTKPKKMLSKNSSFQSKRKQNELESRNPQSASRPPPNWAREEIQEVTSSLLILVRTILTVSKANEGRKPGNSREHLRSSSKKS